jgi:hypothetical protein
MRVQRKAAQTSVMAAAKATRNILPFRLFFVGAPRLVSPLRPREHEGRPGSTRVEDRRPCTIDPFSCATAAALTSLGIGGRDRGHAL